MAALQLVMVTVLCCVLAGNTFTSAVSFSRQRARKRSSDLTDGEELLRALEFLEQYDGERRPDSIGNMIDSNYVFLDDEDEGNYDDFIIPAYDPSLSRNVVDMNGLPPPPWMPRDDTGMGFNQAFNEPPPATIIGDSPGKMTIGQRIEEKADFNRLLNRLVEDAIMEEMLREDAEEAAEMIEEDMANDVTELSSYDAEPEVNYATYNNYDVNVASSPNEDDYGSLDESSYEELDSYDAGSDEDEIDKDLLEAVILRLAEGEMKQKLIEREEETSSDEDDIPNEDLDTEEEIDNFVENIMAELMEGSQDLADKLIDEIDEEKEILEEEEMLEKEDDDLPYGEVVFSDGWDTANLEPDDITCPALDYILDDCMVVDDFPGLGDDGYKEGFAEPCNRHQLCYFCSGTFGIPNKLCDESFKMELMSICNEDPECDFRAKYFWLSAIASRVPSPVALSSCKEPCVMGYLLDD